VKADQDDVAASRQADPERDYATAWEEWGTAGHQAAWESVVADGVPDAER